MLAGGAFLLRDDGSAAGAGWVVGAAESCTDTFVNFMVRRAGGLVSVALTDARANALRLDPMVTAGRGRRESSFTISVEARHGVSTGISASDRALTVRALGRAQVGRFDFTQPGHVFPVRARTGGVLDALAWPEAAVDLARFAGLPLAAAAVCQVMTKGGNTADGRALTRFARTHHLPVVSIADVFVERLRREPVVQPASDTAMPTPWGIFRASSYVSAVDGAEHLALVRGDVAAAAVSVHLHARCLIGDALGSLGCDCRTRLDRSLEMMAEDECGVLVYLDAGQAAQPAARPPRPERSTALVRWAAAADIVRGLGVERAWATGDAGVDAMLEAFGVAVLPNPQLSRARRALQ
ncbi:MAG: 3,4-dihydroxy-2-butanone-4-phosphate synthase [Dehalococcoidia bacterium]